MAPSSPGAGAPPPCPPGRLHADLHSAASSLVSLEFGLLLRLVLYVYDTCVSILLPCLQGKTWEENLPGDRFTQQVTRVLKSTANKWLQNGSFKESALLEPMSSQSGVGGWGCCAGLRLHGASLQRLGSAFQTAGHCVCCGGCHSVKADWDQEGTLGSPATPGHL